MKIPTRIQRKTLNYQNGKETIDALNALLQSFRHFQNALSTILEDDDAGEDQEIPLKKYNEIEVSLQEKEHLQNRITSIKKEKEENKRKLAETTTDLQAARSKIDNEVIQESKNQITSLDSKIREIGSGLKINLRKGRRPISKILHSKNRKLFAFYQHFIEFPLENIDERFWEIVATLEREQIHLSEKERKTIDAFLSFSQYRLNTAIGEYDAAKAEKKKLEQEIRRISLRNHELLRDFEHQKEIAQNELTWISQKLDEIEREKNKVKTDIEKNARILEEMLSKIGSNQVKIELPDDDSASYPNKAE
jgi:predicted  nucleic acid-binding Zn-ribbon protein